MLSLMQRLVRGALGIGKAKLGVDRVTAEVLKARLTTCVGCDRLTDSVWPGCGRRCGECGCGVYCKAQVAGERCPLGKWAA